MTEKEALKLALEALEVCDQSNYGRNWVWPDTAHPTAMKNVREAITAIKEALAQPEPWEKFCDSNCVWTDHHPDCKLAEQKPVAWTLLLVGEHHGIIGKAGETFATSPEYYRRVDVYTTPPQRKPLTDEKIDELRSGYQSGRIGSFVSLARAIEAAHGIKGEA